VKIIFQKIGYPTGRKFEVNKLKGKLGKIRDWMITLNFPPFLLFIILGIISTIWFLIRVIPKPSRASYPCMRVAAPFMSGFILYLLSVAGIIAVSRKTKLKILNVRFLSTSLLTFSIVIAMSVTPSQNINSGILDNSVKFGPDDGPNQPIGKAFGVNPGRVVWIWNPESTNENCTTNFETKDWYWKPENIYEKVVGEMFSSAINKLTGKNKVADSWDLLFHYQNKKKLNNDSGYSKGEKIFIKINQGTARWLLNQDDKDRGYFYPETLRPEDRRVRSSLAPTETNPYVILEILRELINQSGVNQSDIAVGDPMSDIYGHNYDVWHKEFPEVAFIDKFSDKNGRTLIAPTENDLLFYSDKTQSDKLYDVIEKADYLINVANFKPHLSAGISLTAKNHFGSLASETAAHLHYALMMPRRNVPSNGGYHKYRVLVDLMGSKYLGQNTLLYIVDGLFGGGASETMSPVKYFMAPFSNDWSSSLFLSQDQVALESVCFDFLRTEWNGINKHNSANNGFESGPNWNGVDDYLHQAADPSNWPEGIKYDPDNSGRSLSSMGTHEHWNNPEMKQYSRNMGFKKGIELVSIPDSLVKIN
jgi:hypothetical protein